MAMLFAGRWAVSRGRIPPHHAEEIDACFAAHACELFGYASFLTRGDHALADDLVQAAFEAACWAWQGLRSLAEEQRSHWLKKTLANIAIGGFRREAAFRDRLQRIEIRYRKIPSGAPDPGHASGDRYRSAHDIRDPLSLVRAELRALSFYWLFLAGIAVLSWVVLYLL